MIDILESFGYKIDYSDVNFDALEEQIRKLYEKSRDWKILIFIYSISVWFITLLSDIF